VRGILRRLEREKLVMNPPIVGRTRDDRRMIVLDGASRVTAARRLGWPHMIVQVVDYPDPRIGLGRWHHLVVGMHYEELAAKTAAMPAVTVRPAPWSEAREALEERRVLACLRGPGRRPLLISAPPREGLRPIRDLTLLYATDPGLHRVQEEAFPSEWLGEDRVLVLFPRFRQSDIVRFALHRAERLPMGITRHTVPNRALRVFYPAAILKSRKSPAEKRAHLRAFLAEKWARGAIRSYPEPTTVYDE